MIAAAVVARAATLLAIDPWFDELYSLYAASGQPGDAWAAAVADRVHPPGFYYLLWGWLQLADPTPLGLRLLPFAGWLATLAALGWMGRQFALDRTRILALVALGAVNPVLFELGGFVRGYSVLVAVVAIAIGAAVQPPRGRAPWLLLAALVAATWLHYFAWPVVGAIALGLAWQRRWRDAVLSATVPALAFLPWVIAMATSDAQVAAVGQSLNFVGAPGVVPLIAAPGALLTAPGAWLTIETGAMALITSLILVDAFVEWRDRTTRVLVLLTALLPIAAAFAVSQFTAVGAWGMRYFAVSIPALLLLLVNYNRIRPRLRTVAIVLIGAAGVVGILGTRTRHTPWREVHAAITAGGTTIAHANEGFVLLPLRYQAVIAGSGLEVREVPGIPAPDAAPGWLVLRPALLPESYQPTDALRAMGRTVSDSFAMGEGWLEVRGWKFE